MLLDISQHNNQIWLSYYNLDGKTRFKTYDVEPEEMYNWEVCREGDKKADSKIKNWDGRPVKKVKAWRLNKHRMIQYISELGFSDRELIFGYHFPRTYFVDIEVEVTDEFPEPSKAAMPITAICVVTPNRQCIVLATKQLPKGEIGKIEDRINSHFKELDVTYQFEFKCFDSEYDMLYTFLDKFVKNFPMMTGWNFINFDWAYIRNRARNINIDPKIASPIAELGQTKDEFPLHVGIMDYMDIYKKWDRTVDIKEDFKLDTVGEAVLGIRKVKYDGTIQDMYEKEYPKYIFYNGVDTILVQLIHERIKTMEIALTISHLSQVSIFKAGSPVAVTESLICRALLGKDLVMAKDPSKVNKKTGKYAGAFVKPPITGMHSAVACFDFASLYPSIMRQMNVSPESFIKKVAPEKKDAELRDDRIVAINGAVYDTDTSILKEILADLYGQRKTYKKKSFELKTKAYEMEKAISKS
jgi:DNA polymerase elongation subunit (family B)